MLRRVWNRLGIFAAPLFAPLILSHTVMADPLPADVLNPRELIGYYTPSSFVVDDQTLQPNQIDIQEIKIDYDRMNRNLFAHVTSSRKPQDEGTFFLEIFRGIGAATYSERTRVSDGCVDFAQTTRIFGLQLVTRIDTSKKLACAVEIRHTSVTYALTVSKSDPGAVVFAASDSRTPGRLDRYTFRRTTAPENR